MLLVVTARLTVCQLDNSMLAMLAWTLGVFLSLSPFLFQSRLTFSC